MNKEIKRNGHSELTFYLETAVHGISDILKINNIVEEMEVKKNGMD